MRIGFACDWKKNRSKTWSHSALSLFETLKAIPEIECLDVDISIPNYQVYLYGLLNMTVAGGRFRSKFRFSPAYTTRLRKNLLRKTRELAPLDAIIESNGSEVAGDVPCYLYQDASVDMLIRHYAEYNKPKPVFEMYTLDDLKRQREYQLRAYAACAKVFCMSNFLAQSLIKDTGLDLKKVHVVHVGVNVQPVKIATPPPGLGKGPLVLFVGRSFFIKRGDLVIEAFKLVRKNSFSTATLAIAGPPKWPMRGAIPEGVVFLGDASWDVLQRYYSFADVFCMPSYSEGFGIVFAEALCYGIPCIGRNTPVVSETIQHGVNGYLLESDSAEQLAYLMIRAIEDEGLRERVKASVSSYREYYSWNRVASDMIRIIKNDIMGNRDFRNATAISNVRTL